MYEPIKMDLVQSRLLCYRQQLMNRAQSEQEADFRRLLFYLCKISFPKGLAEVSGLKPAVRG